MPADPPNPLLTLHERAGAEFQPYDTLPIVSTFGLPQAEYAAIRKSCALMDCPHRGVIELRGQDRLAFLHGLLTQHVRDLRAGQTRYAFLLDNKGRIITDLNVIEEGERTWLELETRRVDAVTAELEKYRFGEKVEIEPRVGELHRISLFGPGAEAKLNQLPAPVGSWRDDIGHHMLVALNKAEQTWAAAMELGARPIGWSAFNTARIEDGRPLFGVDYDSTVLPAETGLIERAVSFNKGCYVGQEIVARMQSRKQCARRIVGLRIREDALPVAGGRVESLEGDMAGVLTSSTISPLLSGAVIALALLKSSFTAEGTMLHVFAEGRRCEAVVTALPFVNVAG